jgi:hypothetical protein
MMPHNEIPEGLLAAYLQTEYWVHGEPAFLLQIDQTSEALKALYREFHVQSAAFITAYNPWSKTLSEAENRARQSQLETSMAGLGFPILPGIGQDPSGEWPGEVSCLVLGIDQETALRVGREYEQNAIVWCGTDTCPTLVFSNA